MMVAREHPPMAPRLWTSLSKAFLMWLWCLWLALACGLPPSLASERTDPAEKTPWDLNTLSKPPEWTVLERPKADAVQAITFKSVSLRGKPTRVFAWLGLPKLK